MTDGTKAQQNGVRSARDRKALRFSQSGDHCSWLRQSELPSRDVPARPVVFTRADEITRLCSYAGGVSLSPYHCSSLRAWTCPGGLRRRGRWPPLHTHQRADVRARSQGSAVLLGLPPCLETSAAVCATGPALAGYASAVRGHHCTRTNVATFRAYSHPSPVGHLPAAPLYKSERGPELCWTPTLHTCARRALAECSPPH